MNITKALLESIIGEAQLDELSRDGLTTYIQAAKNRGDKDRSKGIALAQLKKWGDKKYGLPEPKIKATELNESMYPRNHFRTLAHAALEAAHDEPFGSEEHHKWMTVHHKAAGIHAMHSGDHHGENVHRTAENVHTEHSGDDEDFHNGESHHWHGF